MRLDRTWGGQSQTNRPPPCYYLARRGGVGTAKREGEKGEAASAWTNLGVEKARPRRWPMETVRREAKLEHSDDDGDAMCLASQSICCPTAEATKDSSDSSLGEEGARAVWLWWVGGRARRDAPGGKRFGFWWGLLRLGWWLLRCDGERGDEDKRRRAASRSLSRQPRTPDPIGSRWATEIAGRFVRFWLVAPDGPSPTTAASSSTLPSWRPLPSRSPSSGSLLCVAARAGPVPPTIPHRNGTKWTGSPLATGIGILPSLNADIFSLAIYENQRSPGYRT